MCNIKKLHGELEVLVDELNLLVAKTEVITAFVKAMMKQTEKDEPEVIKGGNHYD